MPLARAVRGSPGRAAARGGELWRAGLALGVGQGGSGARLRARHRCRGPAAVARAGAPAALPLRLIAHRPACRLPSARPQQILVLGSILARSARYIWAGGAASDGRGRTENTGWESVSKIKTSRTPPRSSCKINGFGSGNAICHTTVLNPNHAKDLSPALWHGWAGGPLWRTHYATRHAGHRKASRRSKGADPQQAVL